MLKDIPFHPDFPTIQEKRQALVDINLQFEKGRRRDHYRINHECSLIEPTPKKLTDQASGTFCIVQLFTNDTVTIQRNKHLQQAVNIRENRPYFPQPGGEESNI